MPSPFHLVSICTFYVPICSMLAFPGCLYFGFLFQKQCYCSTVYFLGLSQLHWSHFLEFLQGLQNNHSGPRALKSPLYITPAGYPLLCAIACLSHLWKVFWEANSIKDPTTANEVTQTVVRLCLFQSKHCREAWKELIYFFLGDTILYINITEYSSPNFLRKLSKQSK